MSHNGAMIGKTEIGRKQLGLDEDTFREMLENVTGKSSRKDCTKAELARFIDYMAQCGAVFTSTNKKSDALYKTKSSARRSDWYEVPDGTPQAPQKRLICALWAQLGYDMTSLDTRVEREFGVATFRWCNDPVALQRIANDLQVRLGKKARREAMERKQAPAAAQG